LHHLSQSLECRILHHLSQTPGCKGRRPHQFACYFSIFSCYFKIYWHPCVVSNMPHLSVLLNRLL
jgi:hypothetical protein